MTTAVPEGVPSSRHIFMEDWKCFVVSARVPVTRNGAPASSGRTKAFDAVSASPQYSSRLGRQASVVEGDDGDSFEESD